MNLTLHYEDGGMQRSLDLLVDAVSDLRPIFKRVAKYKRPIVQARFDQQGPGWAPLAESTMEHRQGALAGGKADEIRSRSMKRVSRKLAREQTRAGRNIDHRLARPGADVGKIQTQKQRILSRHAGLRSEFERISAGGQGPLEKTHKNLMARVERAQGRAEQRVKDFSEGKALGQIANSIEVDIQKGYLEIRSRIPWAGVHNEGGSAGHGSRIPRREFLAWTPEDMTHIADIASGYMLEKFKRG